MPIHLLFLWHMHQPYYKDLITGEYRLPWVRLHALKDYYGMVKLLDDFPGLHQTFNLVPSLITQIQDYVAGEGSDPFFEVAARPASELGIAEKRFALQYLFQANPEHLIGRYPRYRELWERSRQFSRRQEDLIDVSVMTESDFTDLQVLSQIAWFDEFFLEDPEIKEIVRKGRGYSLEDQRLVITKQRNFLAKVLPAYTSAAQDGKIEISTSPFYHPILPLICDTDVAAISRHGIPLPRRFRHPEDAREQILRGLNLHEQVFGIRPRGMWPSEGSVSSEVLGTAHELGIRWVATDEGVLARSSGVVLRHDGSGRLDEERAQRLYQAFEWREGSASVNMLFRDHTLSDLIGFVYSGMPPKEAAEDFIRRIKESAEAVLAKGKTPVVSIILDGENAWEYYPQSGREFLRRLYEGVLADPSFAALTVSEALDREPAPKALNTIVPGSWINANFDIWIGAPEDNVSWDRLSEARDFFTDKAPAAAPEQRSLALEELLIAEGSDWNWWYGPEHHSANDREFDELYRKHLANVYHALGAAPPDILALPITASQVRPLFTLQTAYIHPQIDGRDIGYFDWLGAAAHTGDRRSSAMHRKVHLLESMYAGIDAANLYCRLDFIQKPAEWPLASSRLMLTIEVLANEPVTRPQTYRLEADIAGGQVRGWALRQGLNGQSVSGGSGIQISMESIFECRIPLLLLEAFPGALLRIRFSLWQAQLAQDVLPQEGSVELHVAPEDELGALAYPIA
ncbi:MAG TPA: glycoside hydrolase family 57 protein [Candidatus Angelobacter sp.]|nr:glycoside hydrolase family 57 protein [Candidatus Angelobacter sp.]